MRRSFSIAALVAFVGSAAFLAAAPAVAQTPGYPPTCNAADVAQNAGVHQIGETFRVTLAPPCVFTPGASVNVTVDGQTVGTKVADASGFITVTIHVVSATELQIDDPVSVRSQCGGNSLVGTGPSQADGGATVSQTVTFSVACPGPGGGVAQPVSGRVAFTGANIAKWAAVALALVAIGALLVVANRRRGHTES
jgi:hypothetical protein